jgi:MoxR-like ATPase
MPQLHPVVLAMDDIVHGKTHVASLMYASLLAGGHVLLEDVPGVGKTTLAHAMAAVVGLPFKRIQCTNDTLPSDIIGASLWHPGRNEFEFKAGPVFSEVLVVDEINRASAKTQSALLEAMEEQQVTVDGVRHALPDPFWVVATQNPAGHGGTADLPESQLDRFLIKTSIGYPDEASEKRMLRRNWSERRGVFRQIAPATVLQDRDAAQHVSVEDGVLDYLYRLVRATRDKKVCSTGLSPRAAQGLLAMTRSWAWLAGRSYAIPDDIQAVFAAVATHRIQPFIGAPEDAVEQLLNTVAVGV